MKLAARTSRPLLFLTCLTWLVTAALVYPPQKSAGPVKINFSKDILPILADKCFKCHGPDSTARMANMRLDTAEGAFADRGGKWPIVPGKPADSLVVQRITSRDNPMPPTFSDKTLTQAEIDTITEWIREGARYGKLWSFEPLPRSVPVPNVKTSWPRNAIDRFIFAGLQKVGLNPSKEANKERLLRRVTYDLTGLPPTLDEIKGFDADGSPEAYEKVVDRLLASPHFGERVAVDWLDAARYSDSYGYQSDLIMPSWPYRDWVIKAFNENLPYDQFLTDQVAGDLLKSPSRDQVLATAFNRLHRQSNEGGSIALEFKTEYAVDRVSTFGTAMLGLTLGCARCHDHKFDPISQKEFYQLYGYFNSINEYGLLLSTEIVPTPSLLLPTPDQEKQLKALRSQNAEALKAVENADKSDGSFRQWLAGHPSKPEIPGIQAQISLGKLEKNKFPDELGGKAFAEKLGAIEQTPGRVGNAVLLDGDNGIVVRGLAAKERWDSFTWSFWANDARPSTGPIILLHRTGGTDVGFCGFDLMLEDGFLTARVMRHWPGNAVAIRTTTRIPKNEWTHIAWSWDGSGRAAGLHLYIDGLQTETTVLNDNLWKKINAYGDLGPSGGDWAFGQRFRDAGFKGGKLQNLVFADRVLSPLEVEQLYDAHSLTDALSAPAAHEKELREYFSAAIAHRAKAAREELKKAQIALTNAEESVYEISVMHEAPALEPSYLLARGQYDAPRTDATRVSRGVPKVLPALKLRGANDRLALARWLTDPDHPLTSRVAVNRFWQMIFGVGLVETTENFGIQGSGPSNPELLDYLARGFINSGWNVKALLREIVLSATYRQDSARSKKQNDIDPDNRLLARGPSGRLSAEMIRDGVLASSDLLNRKVGGPPVNPYQPAGIWQENNTMSPPFVQSKGQDLYRRSVYTTWKRTTPMPSQVLFDATSREACTVRRQTTDTPLQALVLLNDVQFVEAARALADLVLKTPGTDSDRIALAFKRLAGRDPDERETSILLQTLKEQRGQFDPKSAKAFLGLGESKSLFADPIELAAMTVTVQTILKFGRGDLEAVTRLYTRNMLIQNQDPEHELQTLLRLTRRQFLGRTAQGFGAVALASMLPTWAMAQEKRGLDHPAKAKRIIYLFQAGGPAQQDLFDYKPLLNKMHGQPLPDSVRHGQRLTAMSAKQSVIPLAGSPFKFEQHGQSGAWFSEILPHLAGVSDDLCFVKSMFTEAINHDPAITFFQTGSQLAGRPSFGSWVSYGLGSMNEELPTFVVLASVNKGDQPLYARLWGSGFLDTRYQGVRFRSGGDPVLYLSNPDGVCQSGRRAMLDRLSELNRDEFEKELDPEIESRVSQYEMAYRMQTSVPEVTDLSKEPAEVFDLYGPDSRKPGTFAANCLLARRLAQKGVRFIQLYHQGWDQHGQLVSGITTQCNDTDQPTAALIKDLKRLGMLEDTLIVWGGEFGRTSYSQGPLDRANFGRDHHPRCFTMFMAGGGAKPGITYGRTDDYGYNIADANGNAIEPTKDVFTEGAVHVHDLQATILWLMGVDHKKLTYAYQGRDFRLTDVHGHLVNALMA